MVGFCMYQAFSLKFIGHANKLLKNGTFKRLYIHADFNSLKTEYESGAWKIDGTDVFQTLWYLFVNIIDNMLSSNWKEQWLIATNITRFNYRYTTRERFFKELVDIDKFVTQCQLTWYWAVGINDSKGIFSYLRDHLK